MDENLNTLMGTIGDNNKHIKTLLRERHSRLNEVNKAMELKARNKTPLDESQRQSFHEFTGTFAQEGDKLKETLMGMEHTMKKDLNLHIENSEALFQSLTVLHGLQKTAIKSLRRLIASSEQTISAL